MAAPEISGSKTVRPKHPNEDEVEENDFENNFMRINRPLRGNEKFT